MISLVKMYYVINEIRVLEFQYQDSIDRCASVTPSQHLYPQEFLLQDADGSLNDDSDDKKSKKPSSKKDTDKKKSESKSDKKKSENSKSGSGGGKNKSGSSGTSNNSGGSGGGQNKFNALKIPAGAKSNSLRQKVYKELKILDATVDLFQTMWCRGGCKITKKESRAVVDLYAPGLLEVEEVGGLNH